MGKGAITKGSTTSRTWQSQICRFPTQHTNRNGTFTYKLSQIEALRMGQNKPKNPPITVRNAGLNYKKWINANNKGGNLETLLEGRKLF